MGCLWLIFAITLPRVVLIVLWLASDYLSRAFQTALWPVLGFFFLPTTTLAYAYAKNAHGSIDGWYLVLVIVAFLWDTGHHGGSALRIRRRRTED